MSMPDDLLDLSPAGYHWPAPAPNACPTDVPITYTLYESESGSILSICYPDAAMAAPVGAINWLGMRSFYRYKGYSICMSFYPAGHFVSILVSRMPVTALAQRCCRRRLRDSRQLACLLAPYRRESLAIPGAFFH